MVVPQISTKTINLWQNVSTDKKAGKNTEEQKAMRQTTVNLNTEEKTRELGALLSHILKPGLKLYLYGDLGAGKTTLTRAILNAAGHNGPVKSPTYALAEHYTVHIDGKPVELVHFDLFRMSSPEEFADAGLLEYFGDKAICIVEWPEKAAGILPQADIDATITITETGRQITLCGQTGAGEKTLSTISNQQHD